MVLCLSSIDQVVAAVPLDLWRSRALDLLMPGALLLILSTECTRTRTKVVRQLAFPRPCSESPCFEWTRGRAATRGRRGFQVPLPWLLNLDYGYPSTVHLHLDLQAAATSTRSTRLVCQHRRDSATHAGQLVLITAYLCTTDLDGFLSFRAVLYACVHDAVVVRCELLC